MVATRDLKFLGLKAVWVRVPPRAQINMETSPITNKIEGLGEKIAREKLTRIMSEDFRDFAVRFVNFNEYQEIMQNKKSHGGAVYAPRFKSENDGSKIKPTLREYLEKCKQRTWMQTIREEVDWPQGGMSTEMYNHLLGLLRKAKNEVKETEQNSKDYRVDVLKKMRELLEPELNEEYAFREDAPKHYEDVLDIMDLTRHEYDIFFIAEWFTQIEEEINKYEEETELLLGEIPWLEISSLISKDLTRGNNSYFNNKVGLSEMQLLGRYALPTSVEEKISSYSLDKNKKERATDLINKICSYKLLIESFGGKDSVELVKKWLDDPNSVELRSFIKIVSYTQMQPNEENQYNLALIIDSNAINLKDDRIDRNWGSLPKEAFKESILGVISIMPDKEMINNIITTASKAGEFSYPVFDSKINVRFP